MKEVAFVEDGELEPERAVARSLKIKESRSAPAAPVVVMVEYLEVHVAAMVDQTGRLRGISTATTWW
jgi:hypothetical protein